MRNAFINRSEKFVVTMEIKNSLFQRRFDGEDDQMKKQSYQKGKNCTIYEGAVLFPNVKLGNNVTIFPGAVIGRPPLSSGATIRKVELSNLLPVEIGDNCIIGANAVIYMGVKIGHHSMICDTACIREECEVGDYSLIAMGVTMNYKTKIGNRVKIMDNTHITGNMIVEDDVFIGMLVTSANDNSMGRKQGTENDWTERGPIVRRFARIGQGACISPRVEIGENAVVGANSVVTKDVPPRTLVMGTPARTVRELSEEEMKPEVS